MTRYAPVGSVTPALRGWRVVTAVRAFTLALITGQVLSARSLHSDALPLLALVTLATACCILEHGFPARVATWIPIVEGVVAGATLGVLATGSDPLFMYLAVPPVVAGIRRGWVTTVNTFLATGAALSTGWIAGSSGAIDRTEGTASATWLLIGLGAGLLASWQTRSLRVLEASQAPYAEAHRVMSQLLALTRRGSVGLDSVSTATDLIDFLRANARVQNAAVFVVGDSGDLEVLASQGRTDAYRGVASGTVKVPRVNSFPLRVGDHQFGAAVAGDREWSAESTRTLQTEVDAWALRLETALLFDTIRSLATKDERNRLAREIHDGVAQEIVALSYLVDEIETLTGEPSTRATASVMREEITRLVGELRFSIFDLRHDLSDQRLSGALAEYVQEVSAGSDLRVHVTFDERGQPLPRRTESELLRILQEAIGNVRKHAGACNLWITLVADGSTVLLRVEDDGVGNATPRELHWGLQTMRERAASIGADLTITPRPEGGTTVLLQSRHAADQPGERLHDHHRSAGR